MAEDHILTPIAASPDILGYTGALSLHEAHLGIGAGHLDLLVIPDPKKKRKGKPPPRLVLVEAKKVAAKDAADKVVGQLLKYYAHARQIGHKGLDRLRAYAATSPEYKLMSLPAAMGVDSEPEAAKLLAEGHQLKPWQIELVIVFDEPAPKLELRLRLMIEQLARDFGLHFRCLVTCDGAPRELWAKQLADQGEIDMPYPAEWEEPYRQQQLVAQWKAQFPGEFDGMSENPEMGKLTLFAQYALMVQLRKRYGIRSLTWYEFGNHSPKSKNRARSDRMWAEMRRWMGDDVFNRLQQATLNAGFDDALKGEPDLFCWNPATGEWFFAEAKRDDHLADHQRQWASVCYAATGTEVRLYRLVPAS